MGVAVLMDYQKNLPNHYSYTETINLDWLKWLTITIPVLFILLFSLIRLGSWAWVAANEMFLYVGAVLAIWGFLIGYFSLRQRMLLLSAADSKIEDKNKDSYLDVPYKKSGLDAVRVENIFLALLSHMDSRQAFLREDLSLSQLAEELALNPNQLSQAINQHSGGNFFSFVNAYRVEEVKKKLLDPAFSHLSILGIALDSGFRSKSAFNRIFKQQVGMGPSEYQKMYR